VLFRTTSSTCSSAFSIGPSAMEEPPKAVGQIQVADRVDFPLPLTVHYIRQIALLLTPILRRLAYEI
jgi:hypothetical protein